MVSVLGKFKFDFKKNPEVEFENLDLVAAINGWSDEQKFDIILLNLAPKLRRKIKAELDRNLGVDKGSFQDRIQWVRKELIKRKKLGGGPEGSASQFASCRIKPGEMVVDFADRIEELAREISSEIPDAAIDRMICGKILESLPTDIASILKSMEITEKETMIRRAQTLMDGHEQESILGATRSVNELEAEIKRLRSEVKTLRLGQEKMNVNIGGACRRCGCRSHRTHECDGRVVCKRCGRKGHIAKICRWNRGSSKENSRIGSIGEESSPAITASIEDENGNQYKALVDSGSPKSIINYNRNIAYSDKSYFCGLYSVCGKRLVAKGEKWIYVRLGNKRYKWRFLVVEGLDIDAIIGRDFLRSHALTLDFASMSIHENVVSSLKPSGVVHRTPISELLSQFNGLFSKDEFDVGFTTLVKHSIETGDHLPVSNKCRRLPKALKNEAETTVKRMLEAGIIRPSRCSWRSPVTMPLKKNGKRRFAIDYRILNESTKPSQYPLPDVDELLERLQGSKIFSTLDLKAAY
ncbi:Retrovirus-related Pol polyprotein from transposon gypsy [Thelohanellus kitauei]|uniref:Retrovirus-related Pol polyprotein from transposon gypsy n=1 Tax=Thelohanellus kitauei TaxID=669202 RepID=A0A0C2MZF8_THEKT|nr:Retrovirus-related Pol polyprotein from transposon gypsy [Thelohanellus kitauei]